MNTLTPRTDWALLRQYVERNSQDAFAALVSRHLNMVYTTCLRELRDATLAEDAAQSVFIILAAKAPKFSDRVNLAGWLFQTARFAAKNARTRQTRRERHEQEAIRQAIRTQYEREQSTWDDAEPLINQAVAKLSPAEREAILLRYWDNLRLAEVGASLGVTEEAARKRIARALIRLRTQLERQGVALGAAALAAALSAEAAHSTPQALAPIHRPPHAPHRQRGISQSRAGAVRSPSTLERNAQSHENRPVENYRSSRRLGHRSGSDHRRNRPWQRLEKCKVRPKHAYHRSNCLIASRRRARCLPQRLAHRQTHLRKRPTGSGRRRGRPGSGRGYGAIKRSRRKTAPR